MSELSMEEKAYDYIYEEDSKVMSMIFHLYSNVQEKVIAKKMLHDKDEKNIHQNLIKSFNSQFFHGTYLIEDDSNVPSKILKKPLENYESVLKVAKRDNINIESILSVSKPNPEMIHTIGFLESFLYSKGFYSNNDHLTCVKKNIDKLFSINFFINGMKATQIMFPEFNGLLMQSFLSDFIIFSDDKGISQVDCFSVPMSFDRESKDCLSKSLHEKSFMENMELALKEYYQIIESEKNNLLISTDIGNVFLH